MITIKRWFENVLGLDVIASIQQKKEGMGVEIFVPFSSKNIKRINEIFDVDPLQLATEFFSTGSDVCVSSVAPLRNSPEIGQA